MSRKKLTFNELLKLECTHEGSFKSGPKIIKTTIGKELSGCFQKEISFWLKNKGVDASLEDFINEAIIYPTIELTDPIILENYYHYYLVLDGEFREHKFTISLFCDEGFEIFDRLKGEKK